MCLYNFIFKISSMIRGIIKRFFCYNTIKNFWVTMKNFCCSDLENEFNSVYNCYWIIQRCNYSIRCRFFCSYNKEFFLYKEGNVILHVIKEYLLELGSILTLILSDMFGKSDKKVRGKTLCFS